MPATIPESHLDLFQKKSLAYLATVLKNGSVQVNPVWCDFEDGRVIVNSVKGRQKDINMRRNPSVTLCIADPENSFRYLEVRGEVEEITESGADAMIDRMAKRYMDVDTYPFHAPDQIRVNFVIRPDTVRASG